MTSFSPDESEQIPNPDALGLIPYFEPPADEPNPDDRGTE